MKLSVRALALTAALLWGGGLLAVGLVNLGFPNYGKTMLELCASVYPGYHAGVATLGNVMVGTLYALLDGAAGGALFAWIYNRLAQSAR
jgi:hypothetical protein